MKMVKSLLLGSAAGLVAVTAGQAAELPVKAQPVQYVKVCSLYGAGFYYMPGTDMCIKIGGWTRAEAVYGNINGSSTWGPFAGTENTRATSNDDFKVRGYITADAREQTAYGVARGYIAVGLSTDDTGTSASEIPTAGTYANRAFVQWAGFTAGKAQSMFDFYSLPANSYRVGPAEDTGDGGWWIWAYTAQFGGGFSATLSMEAPRRLQIIGQGATDTVLNSALLTGGTITAIAYGGIQAPDIVANLRVDQAWGSAQIMGAAHYVNAQYYTNSSTVGAEGDGGPAGVWGYAVGAGLKVNLPTIAPGDFLQTEVNYTVGAARYTATGIGPTNYEAANQTTEGFGVFSDCVYGATTVNTGGSCQLTTAWNVNVGYEHYWTPQWHQSLVGYYQAVSYNATANNILCDLEQGNGVVNGGTTAVVGCNNNFSLWGVSSRLQYDITKSMYIGVEALYLYLDSGSQPGAVLPTNLNLGAPLPAALNVANQSGWEFSVRIHKDFLP
jgi:hypothetical protein